MSEPIQVLDTVISFYDNGNQTSPFRIRPVDGKTMNLAPITPMGYATFYTKYEDMTVIWLKDPRSGHGRTESVENEPTVTMLRETVESSNQASCSVLMGGSTITSGNDSYLSDGHQETFSAIAHRAVLTTTDFALLYSTIENLKSELKVRWHQELAIRDRKFQDRFDPQFIGDVRHTYFDPVDGYFRHHVFTADAHLDHTRIAVVSFVGMLNLDWPYPFVELLEALPRSREI